MATPIINKKLSKLPTPKYRSTAKVDMAKLARKPRLVFTNKIAKVNNKLKKRRTKKIGIASVVSGSIK